MYISVDLFLIIDFVRRQAASDPLLLVFAVIVRPHVSAIRRAQEKMRQTKRHVTRIFAVAERAPRHELRALENLREVTRIAERLKRVDVKHLRTCRRDKWSMRGRCYVRQFLEPLDVLRAASKLVIANDDAVR